MTLRAATHASPLCGAVFAVTLAASVLCSSVDAKTIRANFTCADRKTIEATFHDGPQSRVRLALSDRRHLVLPQARSGSGARYANQDETVVFWNKGDTAFIEEHGQTTYRDCVVAR